jgi:hypothetical protein
VIFFGLTGSSSIKVKGSFVESSMLKGKLFLSFTFHSVNGKVRLRDGDGKVKRRGE